MISLVLIQITIKIEKKHIIYPLLAMPVIALLVFYRAKLAITFSDPQIFIDKIVEATGLLGNSFAIIGQYFLIVVGCFLLEITILGWESSSVYRMTYRRDKSIIGDITCWFLALFGVYDFIAFVSTFGLFYLLAGVIQSNLYLGFGELIKSEELLFVFIFILSDFKNYIDHYVNHHISSLWAVHMYHHSATSLNFITSYRFHFLSKGISMIFNASFFALIGAPPDIFAEIYLITMIWRILLHGNIKVNIGWLGRNVFVTPQLHKIHHSSEERHFNKNFGTIFIFWDRMLGTYHAEEEVREVGIENGPYNKRGFIYDMYIGFKMFIMNLTSSK